MNTMPKPKYTVFLEPGAVMLVDVDYSKEPQAIAEIKASQVRKNPPPHLHPEAHIVVKQGGKVVGLAWI